MKHYDADQLAAWQELEEAIAKMQKTARVQISLLKKRQATRLRGRKYRMRLSLR